MAKENVIKYVEETIKMAKIDIKKNGSTSDKIRQFATLVNSYSRLITQSEILDGANDSNGDPNYYNEMVAE